jgi:hypothetical protein
MSSIAKVNNIFIGHQFMNRLSNCQTANTTIENTNWLCFDDVFLLESENLDTRF